MFWHKDTMDDGARQASHKKMSYVILSVNMSARFQAGSVLQEFLAAAVYWFRTGIIFRWYLCGSIKLHRTPADPDVVGWSSRVKVEERILFYESRRDEDDVLAKQGKIPLLIYPNVMRCDHHDDVLCSLTLCRIAGEESGGGGGKRSESCWVESLRNRQKWESRIEITSDERCPAALLMMNQLENWKHPQTPWLRISSDRFIQPMSSESAKITILPAPIDYSIWHHLAHTSNWLFLNSSSSPRVCFPSFSPPLDSLYSFFTIPSLPHNYFNVNITLAIMKGDENPEYLTKINELNVPCLHNRVSSH